MTTKKLAANSDELTAAMERLESWSTANRFTYESEAKLASCIDTVLAALERALPLLPLVDVIEKLAEGHVTVGHGVRWYARCQKLVNVEKNEWDDVCEIADTWPDALAQLAQAMESEGQT